MINTTMKNVYHPGETIFLFSKFQPGLSIISEHKSELINKTSVDNSKYVNFPWEGNQAYQYYLINSPIDYTYYAYNAYYSNMSSWTAMPASMYYSTFSLDAEKENVVIERISHSMQCRIVHDEDGLLYEDLPWTDMLKMENDEFYYNFCIPFDFTPGQYQIIYKSEWNRCYYDPISKMYYTDEQLNDLKLNTYNKNDIAYSLENFYVNIKSMIYEDVVKIVGYVNYEYTTIPAEDVRISIYETNTETNMENKVYQSLTDREGYWEAYLYPNQYKFVFSRNDYNSEVVYTEITDDNNHLQFETISLNNHSAFGNGLFRITDSFTTKTGQPLYGLTISISSTLDPAKEIISVKTNDAGVWEVYLDDDNYLMRVDGMLEGASFNRLFRLKVLPDGSFDMNCLTKNLVTDANMPLINNGTGRLKISDLILDGRNNPINEVQVNVFYKDDEISEENIRAQDYTNANGEYTLFLDPGTYVFEYYHPNFNVITELKTIDVDGTVTTIENDDSTKINQTLTSSTPKYLQTGTWFLKPA